MTEQGSSVEQPNAQRGPGKFTSSMAILKEPVAFPTEIKLRQQPKRKAPWMLITGLLGLCALVAGTFIFLTH